jgi:hypothetical protein
MAFVKVDEEGSGVAVRKVATIRDAANVVFNLAHPALHVP